MVEHFRNIESTEEILEIVQKIRGPWAFVFWDKLRNQVWFGRDFFGRQSLLLHSYGDRIILTSCAPRQFQNDFRKLDF